MYFEYLGYKGKFTKEEACGWYGRVDNLRDIICFQADNLAELFTAFVASVEDYLDFCKELERNPR